MASRPTAPPNPHSSRQFPRMEAPLPHRLEERRRERMLVRLSSSDLVPMLRLEGSRRREVPTGRTPSSRQSLVINRQSLVISSQYMAPTPAKCSLQQRATSSLTLEFRR